MLRTHEEFINTTKRCPYEVNSLREGESIHVAFLANELSEIEEDQLLMQKMRLKIVTYMKKLCIYFSKIVFETLN